MHKYIVIQDCFCLIGHQQRRKDQAVPDQVGQVVPKADRVALGQVVLVD